MEKIKVKTPEGSLVHYDKGRQLDTLCGLYILGDPRLGLSEGIRSNKNVNCSECLKIVALCQTVATPEAKQVPHKLCPNCGVNC